MRRQPTSDGTWQGRSAGRRAAQPGANPERNGDTPAFAASILIYAGGYGCVVAAWHTFRRTPADQAVVAGPYRLSRNPQWVGLVLVLVGAALMTGVLLYLAMLLVVAVIYHLQILAEERACLEQYGDRFRAYLDAVPRYLLFL